MNKKILIKAVLSSFIAIAVIVSVMAISISWYPGALEYGHQFVIEADGFLYLYIPTITEDTHQKLYPAVAMPHAVSNGLHMDVLRTYNEEDIEPSFISEPATVACYTTNFYIYSETVLVQEVDENGNLVFDDEGNPVYVQKTDDEGDLVFDDEGNPVPLREALPVRITYFLNLKDRPNGEYIDIDEITVQEFYFSYYEEPIAEGNPINEDNGAVPYRKRNTSKTEGSVLLKGNSEVFIHMQIYLTYADELLSPLFRQGDIYLEVGLIAEIAEEENLIDLLPEESVDIGRDSEGNIVIRDKDNNIVTGEIILEAGNYFIFEGKLYEVLAQYDPFSDPLPDEEEAGQGWYKYINLSFDWIPCKYPVGRVVRHNGKFYIAVGGTIGEDNITNEPGLYDDWREIEPVTEDDFYDFEDMSGVIDFGNPKPDVIKLILPEWSSAVAYVAGDMVIYNGVVYVANFWTQGQVPESNCSGQGDPWSVFSI